MSDREKGETQCDGRPQQETGQLTAGASGARGHSRGGTVPDTVGTGGPVGTDSGRGSGHSETGGGVTGNAGTDRTGAGTSSTT